MDNNLLYTFAEKLLHGRRYLKSGLLPLTGIWRLAGWHARKCPETYSGIHSCCCYITTIFFDLSRIASLGAIFYLVMDIILHWGLLHHMHDNIDIKPYIVITAIALDAVILSSLLLIKASTDILLVVVALIGMLLIFVGEKIFLRLRSDQE